MSNATYACINESPLSHEQCLRFLHGITKSPIIQLMITTKYCDNQKQCNCADTYKSAEENLYVLACMGQVFGSFFLYHPVGKALIQNCKFCWLVLCAAHLTHKLFLPTLVHFSCGSPGCPNPCLPLSSEGENSAKQHCHTRFAGRYL